MTGDVRVSEEIDGDPACGIDAAATEIGGVDERASSRIQLGHKGVAAAQVVSL